MPQTAIPMTERNMLASREGRKTITRRVVQPQPGESGLSLFPDGSRWHSTEGYPYRCPYGPVGSQLRLTSTWAVHQRFDETKPSDIDLGDVMSFGLWFAGCGREKPADFGKNRPARFMPNNLRLSMPRVELTAVRVERLQEISEADAIAEACPGWHVPAMVAGGEISGPDGMTPVEEYRELWEEINGHRGDYPWSSNCWCWVISYKLIADAQPFVG